MYNRYCQGLIQKLWWKVVSLVCSIPLSNSTIIYKAIRKVYFFCRLLQIQTPGGEIFSFLDELFTSNEIPCENSNLCNDDVKVMMGHDPGVNVKKYR